MFETSPREMTAIETCGRRRRRYRGSVVLGVVSRGVGVREGASVLGGRRSRRRRLSKGRCSTCGTSNQSRVLEDSPVVEESWLAPASEKLPASEEPVIEVSTFEASSFAKVSAFEGSSRAGVGEGSGIRSRPGTLSRWRSRRRHRSRRWCSSSNHNLRCCRSRGRCTRRCSSVSVIATIMLISINILCSHFLLLKHTKNGFKSWISRHYIIGGESEIISQLHLISEHVSEFDLRAAIKILHT